MLEERLGELIHEFPELGQPAVARAAVKYVTARLVPKGRRGAPRKEQLDLAESLRTANAPWRKVYIAVGADSWEARNRLRNSSRQRKRRAVKKTDVTNNRDVT